MEIDNFIQEIEDCGIIDWDEIPEEWCFEINFSQELDKLNYGQKQVYDFIDKYIKDEKLTQPVGVVDALKIFITGGAGTGKTFLLNLIYDNLINKFGEVVMKASFTGMAASHISGQTLHKTFLLHKIFPFEDFQISSNKYMKMVSTDEIKKLTKEFASIKFLIIDEISMVSAEIFQIIDRRLQFIRQSRTLFGGLNVLLFGDLLQLPPISGCQIYKGDLWKNFKFYELKENMRQGDNNNFLRLLNNIRVGEVNSLDLEVLRKKSNENNSEFGDNAIRVYPTNKLVNTYNGKILEMFKQCGVEVFSFVAVDVFPEGVKPKIFEEIQGISRQIKLFKGARVMLRKNLCVKSSLVNGRVGTVIGILNFKNIEVQFDNDKRTYKFGYEIFEEFDIKRKMIPFILCFACTVHKLQGCTLDKAVIYLGTQHFQAGQIYVALSRVRKFEDFNVENLDESRFSKHLLVNYDDLNELERLRRQKTL